MIGNSTRKNPLIISSIILVLIMFLSVGIGRASPSRNVTAMRLFCLYSLLEGKWRLGGEAWNTGTVSIIATISLWKGNFATLLGQEPSATIDPGGLAGCVIRYSGYPEADKYMLVASPEQPPSDDLPCDNILEVIPSQIDPNHNGFDVYFKGCAGGGLWVPVDKFGLLAPYIGFASTILVATVATAVYAKRVKPRKEKH